MTNLRPLFHHHAAGVTLDGAEHGDPKGSPGVFLQGITDSWRSFAEVLPLMPPRIRAIALSYRGHGDSSKPATGYRVSDFAGDIIGAMDAAGIRRRALSGAGCLGALGHGRGAGLCRGDQGAAEAARVAFERAWLGDPSKLSLDRL